MHSILKVLKHCLLATVFLNHSPIEVKTHPLNRKHHVLEKCSIEAKIESKLNIKFSPLKRIVPNLMNDVQNIPVYLCTTLIVIQLARVEATVIRHSNKL